MPSLKIPALLAAMTITTATVLTPVASAQEAGSDLVSDSVAAAPASLQDPRPFTLSEEEFNAIYQAVTEEGQSFEEAYISKVATPEAPSKDAEEKDGILAKIAKILIKLIKGIRHIFGVPGDDKAPSEKPAPGDNGTCPWQPTDPCDPVQPNPGNPDEGRKPAPPADGSIAAMERAVFDQMNETRRRAGSAPLQWNQRLADESRAWSQHQASLNTMVHDTSSYYYNNYGEILAAGPNAGQTAVQQWIESQPHYLPMIYKGHTMGGVGIAKHPTWGYIVTGRMGSR